MFQRSVPKDRTRVFVHAVNGSQDVPLLHDLHRALKQALPRCRVYMLVLIDGQPTEDSGERRAPNVTSVPSCPHCHPTTSSNDSAATILDMFIAMLCL
eukprot:1419711-Amphidinium_carterae.1